jgi:hypothetical protein
MSDSTSERNERLKATMRQKETPLNTGLAQVPRSPNQSSGLKRRPTGHVDPGTGKRAKALLD